MGPLIHLGLIAGLLSVADFVGYSVAPEITLATVIGGVLLDGDKVFEIVSNRARAKKGQMPDITARCRILHSVFAFPFGLILSFLVSSWLPFFAVLLHIYTDSFIPGLIKDGKKYASHSPRKWIAFPFSKKSWRKVTIGWPITYPPEFNRIYTKLSPIIGGALFILSVLYRFAK